MKHSGQGDWKLKKRPIRFVKGKIFGDLEKCVSSEVSAQKCIRDFLGSLHDKEINV